MQFDLFPDECYWVVARDGKKLYRDYPALKGTGITIGEMLISHRWDCMEAVYYITKINDDRFGMSALRREFK